MENYRKSSALNEQQYNISIITNWILSPDFNNFLDNAIYQLVFDFLQDEQIKFLVLEEFINFLFLEKIKESGMDVEIQPEWLSKSKISLQFYLEKNHITCDAKQLVEYQNRILELDNNNLIKAMAHLGQGRYIIGTFAHKAYEYFCNECFPQRAKELLTNCGKINKNAKSTEELFNELNKFSEEELKPLGKIDNNYYFLLLLTHTLVQIMYLYKTLKQTVESYKQKQNKPLSNSFPSGFKLNLIALPQRKEDSPTTPRNFKVSPRTALNKNIGASLSSDSHLNITSALSSQTEDEYSMMTDWVMDGIKALAKYCEFSSRLLLARMENQDRKNQKLLTKIELFKTILIQLKSLIQKFQIDFESTYSTPRPQV